jgi:Lon-like protease
MFRRAVRVLTVRGVDVRLDPSLVLVVVLVAWAVDIRLSLRFDPALSLGLALLTSIIFIVSILAHELGHALEARHRGLHVGGITLFALGGATELEGHGRTARDEFAISFIGPWISLVIAAAAGLVATGSELLPAGAFAAAVGLIAGLVGWANLGLALFNLIPASPLDGGRVLHALVWRLSGRRTLATNVTTALGAILGVGLIGLAAWLVVTRGEWLAAASSAAVGLFIVIGARGDLRREARVGGSQPASAASAAPAAHAQVSESADGPARESALIARSRTVLGSASLAITLVAVLVVPMPYVEYLPGGAVPIAPLVEIRGTEVTVLDGETALLTVRVARQPLATLALVALDSDRSVLPAIRVYPQGIDRQDYLARERARFDRQFEVAAAVGAATAGAALEVTTEVVVLDVVIGGPSDGILAAGDVVLAVDGVPVTSGADLAGRVQQSRPGDTLTLRIVHAGAERDVTIVLAALDDGGQARIGVLVQTAVDELRLPFDILLRPGVAIGGPSAGLMVGVTVYDLLSEEDLLAGRRIAGTGTLDIDGRVGDVGGVLEKTVGAIRAGYDVLLVPSPWQADAERIAAGRIRVIGVDTLEDALTALRTR